MSVLITLLQVMVHAYSQEGTYLLLFKHLTIRA